MMRETILQQEALGTYTYPTYTVLCNVIFEIKGALHKYSSLLPCHSGRINILLNLLLLVKSLWTTGYILIMVNLKSTDSLIVKKSSCTCLIL